MHEATKRKFRANYGARGAAYLPRAVLLFHLQVAIILLVALTILVVFAHTEMREKAFYIALTSVALFVVVGGTLFNFVGRFRMALVLTVFAMYAFPWTSIVYERIVHSGDLIPTIYIIIPAQVSALFLSGRAMAVIGTIQTAGFCALVLTDPARDAYNWASLVCFVVFASALGAITSYVFRSQYDGAVRTKEQLKESERRLGDISVRDALTGLYNRRRMEDVLSVLIGAKDAGFGTAMLDVDDYKAVNDKYGHACGDALLREIADVIVAILVPGEVAFRYGGDEFLITLSGADAESVRARGEAIRRAVESARYACLGAKGIGVTISVGISLFPDCGNGRDAILRAADRALYVAKRTGKNRVVTCEMLRDSTHVAES